MNTINMPSMILIYALLIFLGLTLTFFIFDEGSLAQKIRKGLSKTFSNQESSSVNEAVTYSSFLLIFLSIGGFVAWIISLVALNTLVIFCISFTSLLILSALYSRHGKKGLNYLLIKTVLHASTSFVFGALLFAVNTFWLDNYNNYLFGITEILAIWLLANWVMMMITNSAILKPLHFLLNVVFLTPYFIKDLNTSRWLGLDYSISESTLAFYFFPLVIFTVNALVYGWFQKNSIEKLMTSNHRNEYLLTGASAFLTLGGVYAYGYFNFYDQLASSLVNYNVEYMFGITTLWLFTVDYICKKTIKNYNANFLVPVLVFVAGLTSYVFLPVNPFIPMLLTSIGFILYMMADYLRKGSPVSMAFFYFAMTAHLTILTFANDFWSLFLLIINLMILVYSLALHPDNKLFAYFVTTSIPLTLIFTVFGISSVAFVVLGFVGFGMLLCHKAIVDKFFEKSLISKKKTKKSQPY